MSSSSGRSCSQVSTRFLNLITTMSGLSMIGIVLLGVITAVAVIACFGTRSERHALAAPGYRAPRTRAWVATVAILKNVLRFLGRIRHWSMFCRASSSPRPRGRGGHGVLIVREPDRYAPLGGVAGSRSRLGVGGRRMGMPVSELEDRSAASYSCRIGLLCRSSWSWRLRPQRCRPKEHLGFEPVSEDPYGPELVSGFLLLSLLVYFYKKHGVSPAEGLFGLNYGVDLVGF